MNEDSNHSDTITKLNLHSEVINDVLFSGIKTKLLSGAVGCQSSAIDHLKIFFV